MFLMVYCQLRSRRTLTLFSDILLSIRRALLPYTLFSNRALLVLKGTLLNSDNTLLALNWWYMLIYLIAGHVPVRVQLAVHPLHLPLVSSASHPSHRRHPQAPGVSAGPDCYWCHQVSSKHTQHRNPPRGSGWGGGKMRNTDFPQQNIDDL